MNEELFRLFIAAFLLGCFALATNIAAGQHRSIMKLLSFGIVIGDLVLMPVTIIVCLQYLK